MTSANQTKPQGTGVGCVGDLVIAFYPDRAGIVAIEQISDDRDVGEIVQRWETQHVCADADVEVWEAMPGFFYRQRHKEMHIAGGRR